MCEGWITTDLDHQTQPSSDVNNFFLPDSQLQLEAGLRFDWSQDQNLPALPASETKSFILGLPALFTETTAPFQYHHQDIPVISKQRSKFSVNYISGKHLC